MTMEIRTRISRQGWRVIDQKADAVHPRVDHRKRRVHAATLVDLARADLELRGWAEPAASDFAGQLAWSCALNKLLDREQAAERAPYPQASSEVEQVVRGWAAELRCDVIDEIATCCDSAENLARLTGRLEQLLASPELVIPLRVRHTLRMPA
jgi:hypothetical protein